MRSPIILSLSLSAVAVLVTSGAAWSAEITAERSEKGVTIKIGGQSFAEYLTDFKGTPIVWPIIGPTGKAMTRFYPMGEGPDERKDHPHHRSLWFNHGDVNKIDFWTKGVIKHREFVKVEGGKQAVVVTKNDWLGPDGAPVCEDQRTVVFGADGHLRWIDFGITLKAIDKPVKFGDTKEGTFGVRVPCTMAVDAKKGGVIVNSEGQRNDDAWGKPAAWVDYYGPVEGETLGIAILNHPSSFRFPTPWHVRTYGLFAANPFGLHDFKGSSAEDGSWTLKPGETMSLRYRILLHRGDEKAGGVAEAFSAYAKEPR